ncbi:choline transporter Hnm1 [Arthroderma uncinatum]|uniref:choline transporter Hnm1 n=1 Tax=Arthroderma uncinatum TaxID=74035 RepID=UPI00144A776C|nr:choline transporter Hnm1 [Arthroderma uncinatum]KAF3482274.1 choline transporter Hnm1 [Arthroderma uncinatum]
MTMSEKEIESSSEMPQDKIKEVGATVTATESPSSPDLDPMLNSSGHRQELDRNFSLMSMCAIGVTAGNTWIAMGGSITTAIFNGGPPGVIYEYVVVSMFYWFISASIAELASAIPSAAGVYHWATATAGPYGRPVGWFAGYWNALAWLFGASSISSILGNQIMSMYLIFHPTHMPQAWQVALPMISNIGMFLILAGVFVTIIVCAVMPHYNGKGYATNDFVWRDWTNTTGYKSDGLVFLIGMLNGAYSVGTSDLTSHMAEEIPNASKNIPRAILAQTVTGFVTAIPYMIALFYSINDLGAVLGTYTTFPLAAIYHQATGTRAGALGLLIIAFLPTFITCVGCYITAGRVLWTLARDNATPFSKFIGRVHPVYHNPFNATAVCVLVVTVLGCIYVGSTTAFNAFVGCYVQLSTLSYLAAILPHLLRGRTSIVPGPFFMRGWVGFVVNGVSCLYIMVFVVIFCFPFGMPVDAKSMNYASLMTGGVTIFVVIWYLVRRKSYVGPQILAIHDVKLDRVE